MATVTPVFLNSIGGDDICHLLTWALTTANADGSPEERPQWWDRVFIATGTFGGATLTIEGSNDGTNWVALKDTTGAAATLTAAGCLHIQKTPRFMRPNLTTPGTGAAVTVSCLSRRPSDMRV